MNNDLKPWYFSRTIVASLVTVVLSIAGSAGLATAALDADVISDALLQIVTAGAGIVAIFGRIRAKDRIGL
ncbi:hypothetical protein [Limoniibacter endophyticus]|uniref:Holin n=1 Tax=Limoniibacter endophyticus TaxID=1565040 RepID=A0A8J3DHW1_9HYPH|nr:hypothetical protein [Limoniibacter endophyticus]GHC69281.1 hypothetical protein GCM10010136_14940 [Limoniibacter endophyticus]